MAVREGDPLSTGHVCTGITNLSTSLVRTVKANAIPGAVPYSLCRILQLSGTSA